MTNDMFTRMPKLTCFTFGALKTFAVMFVLAVNGISHRTTNVEPLDPSSYVFSSNRLDGDMRLWPSIGNGHIATVFHSSDVLMNGFYNGISVHSHRAVIPSPLKVNVTSSSPEMEFNRMYRLDTRTGTVGDMLLSGGLRVVAEWYAHRSLLPLLVFEVYMARNSSLKPQDFGIFLNVTPFTTSKDLVLTKHSNVFPNVSYFSGQTLERETKESKLQSVHVIFDQIPKSLVLKSGQESDKWTFMAAVHSSKDEAIAAYAEGVKLKESDQLYRQHVEQWLKIWQSGRIDVGGNLTIAKATVASLYNIFSSLPEQEDPTQAFIGLSPSGLSWGDEESYLGHVFWDQETWMYPPILLLHTEFGKMLLRTRARVLAAAAENANRTGYRGLRFPWESALTGTETSRSVPCADQEIHISGDISFSIMQYVWATGDWSLLTKDVFGSVIIGIADFWISRSKYNTTSQLYDILGVMPPDEYIDGVNNSAYTNMVAIRSLESAASVAKRLGFKNYTVYEHYSTRIPIPYDSKIKYHPEYDGYVVGSTVKQADVILLGFPFMWEMPASVRLTDLEIYDKVTSPDGPAMSDSMFAIGWLEMKQYDKAISSFNKMFGHIAGDFQVWTENIHNEGAPNFITGMGGFLQSMLFGFGGIRLRVDRLDIDPTLAPGCTTMNITGLDYKGYSLDLSVTDETMTLTVTSVEPGSVILWILSEQIKKKLNLNESITLKRGSASISESSNKIPQLIADEFDQFKVSTFYVDIRIYSWQTLIIGLMLTNLLLILVIFLKRLFYHNRKSSKVGYKLMINQTRN